jgi:uncharacterized damage-inducible protein DinB
MLPEGARRYLLHGLSATPVTVDRLLRAAAPEDWDRRPDPERFTLREVIAHLADWEPVWQERIQAIRTHDRPTLQSYDESQWAIDHDYAHAVPVEQQTRFRESRARLLHVLQDLSPEEWERAGIHTQWGPLSLEAMAVLILGHDGYHLRQIAEWLNLGSEASS